MYRDQTLFEYYYKLNPNLDRDVKMDVSQILNSIGHSK